MLDEHAPVLIVATQLGVGVGAVDRLLKMTTKKRSEIVSHTHPRATLPALDQVLDGEQVPFDLAGATKSK